MCCLRPKTCGSFLAARQCPNLSFLFGRVFELRNPGKAIFEQSLKDVKEVMRDFERIRDAALDRQLPADPVNLFEAIWNKAGDLVLSGSLAARPSCARRILHLARAVEQRREEQWRQTPETNPL